jgi:AcrR family transcriptional regulator
MRRKVQPEILEAAIKLFGLYGFHGVTTRDLANEADVVEGSIYMWFKSKDLLYMQAVTSVVAQVNQEFTRFVIATVGKSEEFDPKRLHDALRTWYLSISQSAGRLLMQVLIGDDKLNKTAREPLDQVINVIAGQLDRQKKGNRKFNSQAAARTLVRALIWGKVIHANAGAAEKDMNEILQQWLLAVEAR